MNHRRREYFQNEMLMLVCLFHLQFLVHRHLFFLISPYIYIVISVIIYFPIPLSNTY